MKRSGKNEDFRDYAGWSATEIANVIADHYENNVPKEERDALISKHSDHGDSELWDIAMNVVTRLGRDCQRDSGGDIYVIAEVTNLVDKYYSSIYSASTS